MPSAPQMQRSGFCEERRRWLFEALGQGNEHEQQHEVEKRGGHASVRQQQQAAVQREDAYAEMVLSAAAKLRQEANQREAAYLQSVRAAQEQEQANNGLVAKALSIRVTLYDD